MNFNSLVPLIVAMVFIIGVFVYLTVLKYDDIPTKRAVGFAFLVSAIAIPLMYLFFRSVCLQNVFGSSSVLDGSYTIENEKQIINMLETYKDTNMFLHIYYLCDTLFMRIGIIAKIFEFILSLNIFLRIFICFALVVIYELILGKVLNFKESFQFYDELNRRSVQAHNARVREHNASINRVYEHKTTITNDYYNSNIYHVEQSSKDITNYKDEKGEPLSIAGKRMLLTLVVFFVSPIVSSVLFGVEAVLGWILTKRQK